MNFENLLVKNKNSVERYVFFRISNHQDAEDILQETYLSAYRKYESLNDENLFRQWLIKIAKNNCNDYYRRKKTDIDDDSDLNSIADKTGVGECFEIMDIINSLEKNQSEILSLYYFFGYSQAEIAKLLCIPIGTVKSRLHTARKNFKYAYTEKPQKKLKGVINMRLPKIMPKYEIISSDLEPFDVSCEELMGWLIVPKLGEKAEWALYNAPDGIQTERVKIEVVGRALVHGIEGVEIVAKEYNPVSQNITDSPQYAERKFVAQLTDTHCRFLAESHRQNGITRYYTFLDDDEFTKNWGYGESNCGKEINLHAKGQITEKNDALFSSGKAADIVGRYIIKIHGRQYDTICLTDIETYDDGVVTRQYIDKNGRTVLWRRFNADDWKYEKYNRLWSEILPENERITVNGKVYVHWYDCISDYITR